MLFSSLFKRRKSKTPPTGEEEEKEPAPRARKESLHVKLAISSSEMYRSVTDSRVPVMTKELVAHLKTLTPEARRAHLAELCKE